VPGVRRGAIDVLLPPEKSPSPPGIDAEVCEQIRAAIQENPTHGARVITAVVRER
jgi:hypothetical protein